MRISDEEKVKEFFQYIKGHQLRNDRHPLTCGRDTSHGPLKVNLNNNDELWHVELYCSKCGYQQGVPKFLVHQFRTERL